MFHAAEHERAVGVGHGLEQAGPDAGMGPAAELAVGGVGGAHGLGQVAPGAGVAGDPENGIEPGADVVDRAAGALAFKERAEDVEFAGGEVVPGARGGVALVLRDAEHRGSAF